MDFDHERYRTVDEISFTFRIAGYRLITLAVQGKIPGLKIGNEWRFDPQEIVEALREQIIHRSNIVTPKELAIYYDVSTSTIIKWYRAGLIPAEVAIDSTYRFDFDRVKEALREKAHLPEHAEGEHTFWGKRTRKLRIEMEKRKPAEPQKPRKR